ncbi:hypothetical protein L228DRAFT_238362 [Xylona heveae TC161]|uniref:C2H2-type domain-containing protein n=1 Tax=Xylona heveae (strain CBS 132557 / TC161) TaxID=1328760 RepID=A0A161TDD3_XYLHT|nr:hypothetical protein L228DRAFT_238362 [Xylona heveae TC161]KZF23847.1 hypothetical protein L228DRAFT_238362 [Xylona heveae TC161]
MASNSTHPRRGRVLKPNAIPPIAVGQSISTNTHEGWRNLSPSVSLRKGSTFHSPSSPASKDDDPVINVSLLPRRSHTSTQSLEAAIAAGERRMAALIGSLDRTIAGNGSPASSPLNTLHRDALPLPRGLIDPAMSESVNSQPTGTTTQHSEKQQRRARVRHTSDSGLGSSIGDSVRSKSNPVHEMNQRMQLYGMFIMMIQADKSIVGYEHERARHAGAPSRTNTRSAITRSLDPSADHHGQCLSECAAKHIKAHIIDPLLEELGLKPFHPLVRDMPRRMENKEITCLRDLEKTLLYLAPGWAVSRSSYLDFCETSIQCIHTTVKYLNEKDQRRPTDRPYTNGYFLDLVEQIRQYASMITSARSRAQSGQSPRESDYDPNEKLELRGGLSETGRPAQLVRVKNGKVIPIPSSSKDGRPFSSESDFGESSHAMKRSLSEVSLEDDGVQRSMARRRKSMLGVEPEAPPACGECGKVFKRACDLTKHVKTHSRPWKCSEPGCKYAVEGWPTEKERDRHVNDKHCKEPKLFQCQFSPCTYQSKRESNCKQHMEKSHGWTYVRTKNNGKRAQTGTPLQTPSTAGIATPSSFLPDPVTPVTQNTHSPLMDETSTEHSTQHPALELGISPATSLSFDDALNSLEGQYGSNDLGAELGAPWSNASNDLFGMGGFDDMPLDSNNMNTELDMANAFDPTFTPEIPENFNDNFNLSSGDADLINYNAQLLTPSYSAEHQLLHSFPSGVMLPVHANQMGQASMLSSGVQPDLMLYSPCSANDLSADEGFDEFTGEYGKPIADFSLYGDAGESSQTMARNTPMFQDWSLLGNQQAQTMTTDPTQWGVDTMQLDE